jgi:hypothetical protein
MRIGVCRRASRDAGFSQGYRIHRLPVRRAKRAPLLLENTSVYTLLWITLEYSPKYLPEVVLWSVRVIRTYRQTSTHKGFTADGYRAAMQTTFMIAAAITSQQCDTIWRMRTRTKSILVPQQSPAASCIPQLEPASEEKQISHLIKSCWGQEDARAAHAVVLRATGSLRSSCPGRPEEQWHLVTRARAVTKFQHFNHSPLLLLLAWRHCCTDKGSDKATILNRVPGESSGCGRHSTITTPTMPLTLRVLLLADPWLVFVGICRIFKPLLA